MNARADFFVVLMKIVLIYAYLLIPNLESHWFHLVLINFLALIAFFNFRYKWPFYSEKMNKFMCVLTGFFLWSNMIMVIDRILETTKLSGGL